MTSDDVAFLLKILQNGLIQSPCLELGVGYGGNTCKDFLVKAGITYIGTDMVAGPYVDCVLNFEESTTVIQQNLPYSGDFGSALVLNVLEHTFEPIKVLDNVFAILRPGGVCVIVTPAVWPLHNYPYDCYRVLPNFYEEYCKRRSLELLDEYFDYIGKRKVRSSTNIEGYVFPEASSGSVHKLMSRIIHKIFNTSGRGIVFPNHIAIGALIRKPSINSLEA